MNSTNPYVGQRLSFGGESCTVRYHGEIKELAGQWLGVEWDDPNRGKHNGVHLGIRYFTCRSKERATASFVRPQRESDACRSFLEALKWKYASGSDPESLVNGTPVYFNGKLAEAVGFEKVAEQFAALQSLQSVLLDGMRIKQPGPSDQSFASVRSDTAVDEIKTTCPSITRLGLSRNLFERFSSIASICSALPQLKSLDVSHNRFCVFELDSHVECRKGTHIFASVLELNMDFTLLKWEEFEYVLRAFPQVSTLSFVGNGLEKIRGHLPANVETLILSSNAFKSLSDVEPLARSLGLRHLSLHQCPLKSIARERPSGLLFPGVEQLDVSGSNLNSKQLCSLGLTFPKLTTLRCSALSEDETLDVTASIGTLRCLNSTMITPQSRMNAELYFMGKIAQLIRHDEHRTLSILEEYPWWSRLCAIHGEPMYAESDSSNIRSEMLLDAQMVVFHCHASEPRDFHIKDEEKASFVLRLPKTFTTYLLYMHVAERFNTSPRLIEIYKEKDMVEMSAEGAIERRADQSMDSESRWRSNQTEKISLPRSSRSVSFWFESRHTNLHIRRRK